MASTYSFDVVSKVDMQEVDNAINQAIKEISQRYDFKGSKSNIELIKDEIKIISDDEYKLKTVIEILKGKLVKRGISPKALEVGKIDNASLGSVKVVCKLVNGISKEKAKEIVVDIKSSKIKVQAQIQEDELRISSKDKDELQRVISLLKEKDFGIALQFTNYR
ncbi:hypothetical protein SAMN02745163_03287 [Clostridium cavendishii DSM 21758]|uniref:Nucleotide-binding protein SAMN02745163_03287 n=1 Tax=Clostridium cavendishii DSM 21758 TaxID=1121302 RepID=A0A1M6Q4U3_9CLOT|nr:YajQ family cyclic di-GMP-binding protein [Clostridium cavendishii]SHK15200.1 hypothetical protein SAMN02745163_03287 [Clostridium cavendishii DSM 21758]